MKKKVALLLALVMVMGLIPMNVFGRPAGMTPVTPGQPAGTVENLFTGMGQLRDLIVTIPISRLQGANVVDSQGRIRLTAHMSDARTGEGTWSNLNNYTRVYPVRSTNDVTSGSAVRVTITSWDGAGFASSSHWFTSMAEIYIEYFDGPNGLAAANTAGSVGGPVPAGSAGNIVFLLPSWTHTIDQWIDAWLNIWAGSPYDADANQNVLVSQSITTVQEYSINIGLGSGAPRNFSSALLVPDIVFRESRAGAISNRLPTTADMGSGEVTTPYNGVSYVDENFMIRLEAPQYYTWAFDNGETVGRNGRNPIRVPTTGQLLVGGGRLGLRLPLTIHNNEDRNLMNINGAKVTHSWIDGAPELATSRHVLWIAVDVPNRRMQTLFDEFYLTYGLFPMSARHCMVK